MLPCASFRANMKIGELRLTPPKMVVLNTEYLQVQEQDIHLLLLYDLSVHNTCIPAVLLVLQFLIWMPSQTKIPGAAGPDLRQYRGTCYHFSSEFIFHQWKHCCNLLLKEQRYISLVRAILPSWKLHAGGDLSWSVWQNQIPHIVQLPRSHVNQLN